jgi:hypothetical protein
MHEFIVYKQVYSMTMSSTPIGMTMESLLDKNSVLHNLPLSPHPFILHKSHEQHPIHVWSTCTFTFDTH